MGDRLDGWLDQLPEKSLDVVCRRFGLRGGSSLGGTFTGRRLECQYTVFRSGQAWFEFAKNGKRFRPELIEQLRALEAAPELARGYARGKAPRRPSAGSEVAVAAARRSSCSNPAAGRVMPAATRPAPAVAATDANALAARCLIPTPRSSSLFALRSTSSYCLIC